MQAATRPTSESVGLFPRLFTRATIISFETGSFRIVGFASRLCSPSRTMFINGESDNGGNPANCWTQLTPFTASSTAALEAVEALTNWRYRANSASLAGTTSKPLYCWAHLFHLKNALTYLLVVEAALLDRIVDFSASGRALNSGFWNFSKVLHIPLPNTSVGDKNE